MKQKRLFGSIRLAPIYMRTVTQARDNTYRLLAPTIFDLRYNRTMINARYDTKPSLRISKNSFFVTHRLSTRELQTEPAFPHALLEGTGPPENARTVLNPSYNTKPSSWSNKIRPTIYADCDRRELRNETVSAGQQSSSYKTGELRGRRTTLRI